MRRYLIHAQPDATWTLVYDNKSGHWHIEKAGEKGMQSRFSLEEFESSDSGKFLSDRLLVALHEAEQDA